MVGVVAAVGAVKWRRSALGDVDGDSLRGASGGDSAVNTSPREDNSPPSPMIKNQAFQGPDDAIPAAVYAKLEGPDSRGVADKPAGVYDRVGASPALHEDPHAGPESNTYDEPDPFVGLRNNTVYAVVGLMDLAAGGGVGQADYATLGANSSAKRGAASALAAGTYAELVPVAGSLPTATYATLDLRAAGVRPQVSVDYAHPQQRDGGSPDDGKDNAHDEGNGYTYATVPPPATSTSAESSIDLERDTVCEDEDLC